MPSSTVSLQSIINDVLRDGDAKPVLQTGGSSMEPALTIANITMAEMMASRFNWKFNSFNLPIFQTISWQNDYAIPGVTTLGWLENGVVVDINSTQIPKRKYKLEVVRSLQPTSDSYGRPFQVSWMANYQLQYGSWGSGLTLPNTNSTGQTNPGPGVVYTNPLGTATTPSNPITQITDPNGNLQVLTTYGTCGSSLPTFPAANAPVGTNTTDGTCVWTVVDPYGQGFRMQAIPAQSGTVWQVMLVGQNKPTRFTALNQFINPLPDDFSHYFLQGFRAHCYQRSIDSKVRAKFQPEYELWLKSMADAVGQADRETESFGAYPSESFMGDYESTAPNAANPYNWGW